MDDLINDDVFLLTFPLWIMINRNDKAEPFVLIRGGGIEAATPLFTDSDLLNKFAEPSPIQFHSCELPNAKELLIFLDAFEKRNFTHVAIDPTLTRSRFHAISELREHLYAGIEKAIREGLDAEANLDSDSPSE